MAQRHISSVSFEGFKGGSGAVSLFPRTVLTGPNGSGKTRTIEAIQTAILGHVPKHGRRALAGLMSTDAMRMTVGVEVSDKEPIAAVERRFDRTDKGVANQKLRWNGGKLQSEAAVAKELAEHFGSSTVALDVGELLRMTAGERTKVLLGYLPAADVSVAGFIAAVEGALGEELLSDARTHLERDFAEGGDLPSRLTLAREGIRTAIADLGDEKRRLQGRIDDAQAKLGDSPVPSDAPTEESLSELADEIRSLRTTRATYHEHGAALARWEQAIANAENALSDAQARKEAADGEANRIAAETPPEQSPSIEDMEAERDRLQEVADDLYTQWKAVQGQIRDAENEVAGAEAEHGILRANLEKVEGCSTCPTCRQSMTEEARGTLDEMLAASREKLDKTQDRLVNATRSADELGEALDSAADKAKDATFRAQNARVLGSEWSAMRKRRLEGAQRDAEQAAESASRATAALADIKGRRPEGAPPEGWSAEAAQAEIAEREARLEQLREANLAATRWTETQQAMRQLEGKVEHVEVEAATLRQVSRAVTEASARIIAEALDPLTATTSDILRRVDAEWRLDLDVDRGLDLLAWTGGERPVPFSALSGGEAVAFISALAVALIRLIDPPLRVLLLEAAEVDEERLPALLDAITVVGPDLHTVVVSTCHAGSMPEAWNVVTLDSQLRREEMLQA